MADGADRDWDATVTACHACVARGRALAAHAKRDGADTHGIFARVFKRR